MFTWNRNRMIGLTTVIAIVAAYFLWTHYKSPSSTVTGPSTETIDQQIGQRFNVLVAEAEKAEPGKRDRVMQDLKQWAEKYPTAASEPRALEIISKIEELDASAKLSQAMMNLKSSDLESDWQKYMGNLSYIDNRYHGTKAAEEARMILANKAAYLETIRRHHIKEHTDALSRLVGHPVTVCVEQYYDCCKTKRQAEADTSPCSNCPPNRGWLNPPVVEPSPAPAPEEQVIEEPASAPEPKKAPAKTKKAKKVKKVKKVVTPPKEETRTEPIEETVPANIAPPAEAPADEGVTLPDVLPETKPKQGTNLERNEQVEVSQVDANGINLRDMEAKEIVGFTKSHRVLINFIVGAIYHEDNGSTAISYRYDPSKPVYMAGEWNEWLSKNKATPADEVKLDSRVGYFISLAQRPEVAGKRFTLIQYNNEGKILWSQYGMYRGRRNVHENNDRERSLSLRIPFEDEGGA